MTKELLEERFGRVPIIGMIHLSGGPKQFLMRALEEINTYEEEGVAGAIIENYHAPPEHVQEVVHVIQNTDLKIKIGVNLLPNEFEDAVWLSTRYNKISFMQLDHVAGTYTVGDSRKQYSLNESAYMDALADNKELFTIGGVWPKYYTPIPGSNILTDLLTGSKRADAIAITGEGTGKETPLEKIKLIREILPHTALIVAAGITPSNIYEQLMIADGAIVGSYFKPNADTERPVNRELVKELMQARNRVLEDKYK